jgi:hypothetical protein
MPTFRNTLFHLQRLDIHILHIQPLKTEQIECSETSAFNNQTPGKYPKDYTQDSKHGESLKSRLINACNHKISAFRPGLDTNYFADTSETQQTP